MTSATSLPVSAEESPDMLFELRFPARPDRLKLMRSGIRSAAWMCGFDDTTAQNIVLAVDEACQNIIVHGYAGRQDGEIILGVFRCRNGILIRLRDFAPPVDPRKIKPRALDDIKPGKLGTHFMREIMDSVEFRPNPNRDGNILEMIKRTDGTP